MLSFDMPANIKIMHSILIAIATFEIIDGDIIKEHLWKDEGEEEEINPYFEDCGYDSQIFQYTFGLPLYIFAWSVVLLCTLPTLTRLIDCIRKPKVTNGTGAEVEADVVEGGENDIAYDPKFFNAQERIVNAKIIDYRMPKKQQGPSCC